MRTDLQWKYAASQRKSGAGNALISVSLDNYKDLKRSFVIFVCTFDLFGEGRHIYTFENRCIQNTELGLGDDTTKIILNTKGTMDDVSPEMKRLLDYMTLQMHYQEKYEQGFDEGDRKRAISVAMNMLQDGDLPLEKIAKYSGLIPEDVLELEKELQPA